MEITVSCCGTYEMKAGQIPMLYGNHETKYDETDGLMRGSFCMLKLKEK